MLDVEFDEAGGAVMVAVPFPVTSASGARPQESAGRLINAYAVTTEQGAPTPLKWTARAACAR